VKPANVLIGEGGPVEGLVKITDFGISHASGDVTLTQTGQLTGTPAFLAPEVAQGHPMTEASDVFSLCSSLYTCLEGTPPFGMEDNALGMLHRVAAGNIVPPRRSGGLTQPLQRMLAADPADRPTMQQIRDELASLAAGRDGDTTTILLARTDLGSAAPGRTRTTSFPAGAAAAAATPAPAAAPPPVPPSPPPPPPRSEAPRAPAAREVGRRRGRALWAAAALVALVLAGLIVVWAVDPFGGDGSKAAEDSSAADSSAPEPTGATDTSQESEESTSASETQPSTAQDPAEAVSDFFALIPGDLPAAHALTSPAFQSEFPLDRFSGFWDDFSSVQISNVESEDATTALVDITYGRPDGSSETERHRITFVEGDDGQLLLDSDAIA
jgi:hypothetical protein